MASDPAVDRAESLFFEALRYGLAGAPVPWTEPPDLSAQKALAHLARAQALQPVIVEALSACPAMAESPVLATMKREARQLVKRQALRTAEFLLLLRDLRERGLRPAVLKGAVCRSLYPEPEQRPSSDEDLMIPPEDFPAFHRALLDCGLQLLKPDAPLEVAHEVTYVDPERDLYLELHMQLFSEDSQSCGDCNPYFAYAYARRVTIRIYGQSLDTFAPTDHLLYMICHAYKHLLYGGVGIRQLCDICLFARRCGGEIDWPALLRACGELKLQTLAAAFFRVGETRLDIPGPEAFAHLTPDETPLLRDCLTGGLYGANDLDRLHSSRMTLEAVAAEKKGRRMHSVVSALFPSAKSLAGAYPYLRKKSWLLPVAWAQRFRRYLKEKSTPGRSVRIGEERIEMLRRYNVLE